MELDKKDYGIIIIGTIFGMIDVIFMFVLAIAQTNFKDRKKYSVAVDVFLVLALMFLSIYSINMNDFQYNLMDYFHEHIVSY